MIRFNKIFFLLLLPLASASYALPDISLEVYRYQSSSSPYIEVSLYVAGPSLICPATEPQSYGISYTLLIKDDAGNIVSGNRYTLTASGCPAKDIIDVKRFILQPGRYSVELDASDLSDSLSHVNAIQQVDLSAITTTVVLSDMEFLSTIKPEKKDEPALNKSGMYLEPLPFRLYYPALNHLYVYHETYHIAQMTGQPYIQYTIKPLKGNIPAPIQAYKKLKKEDINANVFDLDITTLISGPYVLEVNVFDGDKQLKATTQALFNRLNPTGDSIYIENASLKAEGSFASDLPADSLDYYLRAMAPVVNSMDVDVMNTLLSDGNEKAKRFFIHRYWTEQAGKHADVAFQGYMKVARAVDAEFRSGFGYGFETDRGHIFMKYGKWDDKVEVEDEPSAPPYEIWFYNQFPATHQNNVRFLFYNPSLAKNAFVLLHSTATGEVKNERWEVELYRDATLETPKVGETEMGENVHRNARRYFEN